MWHRGVPVDTAGCIHHGTPLQPAQNSRKLAELALTGVTRSGRQTMAPSG